MKQLCLIPTILADQIHYEYLAQYRINEAGTMAITSATQQPTQEQQKLKILLIEDEPLQQMAVQCCLEDDQDLNCKVYLAGNITEGRAALIATQPDLILLDLTLPGSDPVDTLQWAARLTPTTPVIIITGHERQKFEELSESLGAFDYFVKAIPGGNRDISLELIRAIKTAMNEFKQIPDRELVRRGCKALEQSNKQFGRYLDGTQ